jgi:hypothetical protein
METSTKLDDELSEGYLWNPRIVYADIPFPFLEPMLATLNHYSNFPNLCLILPESKLGY